MDNIFFIHIPKTAGMTMEDIFYEKGGCVSLCFFHKNKVTPKMLKNKSFQNSSLWHIPLRYFYKDFQDFVLHNRIIFTIVRNPYDRIISDFKFWIKYYQERKNKKNLKQKERNIMANIEQLYNKNYKVSKQNLNQYIKRVLYQYSKNKSIMDCHYIPMYEFVFIHKKLITRNILKFEDLNQNFNHFVTKYKLPIQKNILLDRKINITSNSLKRNDINEENVRIINKIYAKDFLYFGYERI